MSKPSFWIVRTTLDAYNACLASKRVSATEQTLRRLEKVSIGDYGVFYISTSELHKSSQTISESRTIFIFEGNIDASPIQVPTLPGEKSLKFSLAITILNDKRNCKISDIKDDLMFIKKKSIGAVI